MQQVGRAPVKDDLTEAACLAEAMRLRFGSQVIACPACGKTGRFTPVERQRAFACGQCGHAVYPCKGTPLKTLRTPLTDWFRAIHLHALNPAKVVQGLQRETGMAKPAAERIAREVSAFAEAGKAGGPFVEWVATIADFVAGRLAGAPKVTGVRVLAKPAGSKANAPQAAAPAAKQGRTRLAYGLAGLAAVVAVTSAAVAYAVLRSGSDEALDDDRRFAPELSAIAPRPSMELAAVEEEVASAKAAVEAVIQAEQAAPPSPPPAGMRPQDLPFRSTGDPNQILTFGSIRVRRHLVETIVRASRVVGADPTLMMAIADKESSFSTEVKAQTSSATGLYQFIEKTWLGVVAEFGAKYGLDKEARLVVKAGNGYTVPDAAEKARILEMRRDPYLAALMAGEMLKKDTLRIERSLKRHLSAGEIYLIHFLGPDAAEDLISSVEATPDASGASKFARAADANKSIFFSSDRAKSVAEIRSDFDRMMGQRVDRFREVRRITSSTPPAR